MAPRLLDVNVSRLIDASPDAVYRAWVDPEQYQQWHPVDRDHLRWDPAPGALWWMEVQWEGRAWAHYGRFLALEAPRRLEFTWMSEATGGRDTVVTVTLAPREGKTELALRHAGIPDDELGRGHELGWTEILSEIAKRVARR